MITRLRLPQRSTGQVTLDAGRDTETETERDREVGKVSCRNHSHSLVEDLTASLLFPSKVSSF